MFKIVSMYTQNTGYEIEVKRLRCSMDNLSIPYTIYQCESLGSWEKNCQLKAEIILHELNDSKKNIVWTDADSEVLRYPALFNSLACDIALHKLGNEYLSGTVYFANNARAKQVVFDWIKLNRTNSQWDQRNLQAVLGGSDVSLDFLPAEYCKIFDKHSQRCSDPVIVHYQASRRYKHNV